MNSGQQCVDPELRNRLFTEIMHTGLNTDSVTIPPELLEHANACPVCSSEYQEWVEKAEVGRILSRAREMIREAAQWDPTVQRRETNGRRFYFKAVRGASVGTLVTTDAEDKIITADEGSLDDFLRLQ